MSWIVDESKATFSTTEKYLFSNEWCEVCESIKNSGVDLKKLKIVSEKGDGRFD